MHGLGNESYNGSDVEYITSVVAQLEMIHAVTQEHRIKVIYTEMVVDKKEVKFQVDSGILVNIIPVKFFTDKKLEPTMMTLQMWKNTTLKPLGFCRLILHNPKNKKKFSVELLVVDSHLTPLIGAKAAQEMSLITVNTQNVKITELPERLRPEVIHVQAADEIVASKHKP